MDTMTKEQRHMTMSRIRSKDTKPELAVRKWLHSHGYRYRVCDKRLPGKPDIVMPKYKTVIFVNGCFWHGHSECGKFRLPKTNSGFWKEKIFRNIERDAEDRWKLDAMGWGCLTLWECQLMKKNFNDTMKSLDYTLAKRFLELSKRAIKQ